MESLTKALTKVYSIISETIERIATRLLGLVELFLFLRLLLKFLNASPKALAVDFIYGYTDILILPFKFILPDIYWPKGCLIETATISAMIGYVIAVYIIFQLLKLFSEENS